MRFLRFPLFITKRVLSDTTKLQIVKRQVDFFLSTRVKRSLEVYNFYKNSRTFQELVKHLRQNLNFRNRLRLSAVGAAGLCAFDWDKERLTLDDSAKYFLEEFDRIDRLKAQAEFAKSGKTPTNSNGNNQNNAKTIAPTADEEIQVNRDKKEMESWEFYVQRDNMITWRREEEEGHYSYKVYVSYPDITAEDFLFVQNDIEYRKEWDDTAVALRLIENDEQDQSQPGSIIYWEMMWPKLFSNRDYVFVRKTFVDRERNVFLIVNRSTKHPDCPPVGGLQRVKEFWSYMVIKPKTTPDEPGLEFILTYYDNPGIKIPKYVTSWVAQRQLPDFIDRLYQATINHSKNKAQKWYKKDPGFEYPSDVRLDDHPNGSDDDEDFSNEKVEDEHDATDDSKVQESKSWWRYLLFYNYLY